MNEDSKHELESRSDSAVPSPPKRDLWVRFTALATILIPATIALAGVLISKGIHDAEQASSQRREDQANVVANANLRIARATLVNTLMKSLTSADPQERKIAIEAVVIALGEDGAGLTKQLAEGDTDNSVRKAAKNALVTSLFSSDADTRKGAASQIVQGWKGDSEMVQMLIAYATRSKENANGVYNTVVVLSAFEPSVLVTQKEELRRFLALAKTTGKNTEEKAISLLNQIDASR